LSKALLSAALGFFAVFCYAAYKSIQKFVPFLKKIFDKDSKSSVTVNVGNKICSEELLDFPQLNGNAQYFFILLLEQNKISNALNNLKIDVLREQMDYFFKHIKNVEMATANIIIELLKEAGIDDISYSTYFSNFENFIEVCRDRINDIFRSMCKENHFSEYSQIEYSELVDRNINIIEGSIKELLRKRYPQREFIKDFKKVYSLQGMIRAGLKDCFEYARDVAIEKKDKVYKAKECFELKVFKVTGQKYSMEI
jgi:hypothetical protein